MTDELADDWQLPKVWPTLTNEERVEYLLARPTLPDAAWTSEDRRKGEDRETFIRRVLGVPA
jgi:hypothetical protein